MSIKNSILILSIIFIHITVEAMNKKSIIAATKLKQERVVHLENIKKELATNQSSTSEFHIVHSPCNCIHDSCYSKIELAQLVNSALNQKNIKERKKDINKALPQIMSLQKDNYENRNDNTALNFYSNYPVYQTNLNSFTQKNLELQHAESLLSHAQQCDAAITLQAWRRKVLAQKKTEQIRKSFKLKNQEQRAMNCEDNRTKRLISIEKKETLQKIKEEEKTKKLQLEEARKEAQRQKNKENIQKQADRENQKKEDEKLRKEKQRELSLRQKAQSQLKKEQELTRKQIQQEKDAADLAYLTDIAKQAHVKKDPIAWKASTSIKLDQEQTQIDDAILATPKESLSQFQLNPFATSAASVEEDPINWLEKRQKTRQMIAEVQAETKIIQQKLNPQSHEKQMETEQLNFKEKTLRRIFSVHNNSIEHNDFTAWQEQQNKIKKEKCEEKEIQRKKNLKTILRCKACDRETKKTELAQKLEKDFAYSSPTEKSVIELFESYDKALDTKTSLDAIKRLEIIFIESEDRLKNKNESIRWYLFDHPKIYNKIKQKYLSLQRTISPIEKAIIIQEFESLKKARSSKSLPQDVCEKLQNEHIKMISQVLQIQKLEILENIHTNDGVLDISKLLYPNQSSINLESTGKLSQETLDQAEIEIKNNLSKQKHIHDLNVVAPTITDLLQRSGIDPSIHMVHKIINSSAETTRIPKPQKSSLDFLKEIKKSLLVDWQRANELSPQQDTLDQVADKVKVHACVVKAFMDIAEKS